MGQILRVKPPDLVVGKLWDATVRDHGLTPLGGLEVVSLPQARPVLSMAHGTRSAPDISESPIKPSRADVPGALSGRRR